MRLLVIWLIIQGGGGRVEEIVHMIQSFLSLNMFGLFKNDSASVSRLGFAVWGNVQTALVY